MSAIQDFLEAYLKLGRVPDANMIYHKMVNRLFARKTAVLPVENGNQLVWVLLQPEGEIAGNHAKEISYFIRPYIRSNRLERRQFVVTKTLFATLGASLFPEGYYAFTSSVHQQDQIWRLISYWIELDERRPTLQSEEIEESAFTLRRKFQEEIALQQYEAATQTLHVIRQGHYISDENMLFLTIYLLGHQCKWGEIWYSAEFDLITGLDLIPQQIRRTLILAYYQSVLAKCDQKEDFVSSLRAFEETKYRLRSLTSGVISLNEPYLIRVVAYEAMVDQNMDRVRRLESVSEDDLTMQILAFVKEQISEEETVVEEVTIEDKGTSLFLERRYDDAYYCWLQAATSKQKAKYLSKIATMTDSDDVYLVAYQTLSELSKDEQEELTYDPDCRADLLLVENRIRQRTKERDKQEPDIITWNYWFSLLLDPAQSIEELDRLRRKMDPSHSFVWTQPSLQALTEILVEFASSDMTSKQRMMFEANLSSYVTALIEQEQFPQQMANDVYDYTCELMMIHGKRSNASTIFFLRLIEGLMRLDPLTVDKQWHRFHNWINIQPNMSLLLPLLQGLELFFDYSVPNELLAELWNHWTGTLGDRLLTLDRTDLESWYEVGIAAGGQYILLKRIQQALTVEPIEDAFASSDPMRIVIFTLREHTAKRAVERLLKRNPNMKFTICSDNTLTAEAKAHACHADIVMIVTSCLSHALFYGIIPYVQTPLYPRSSGSSGIIHELESYFSKRLEFVAEE